MFKTRADLKTYINTYIIPNGVRSITGTHGNTILTDMVDSLWGTLEEHKTTLGYLTGECVVKNTIIYQAKVDIVAGPFDDTQWEQLTGVKPITLAGFNTLRTGGNLNPNIQYYVTDIIYYLGGNLGYITGVIDGSTPQPTGILVKMPLPKPTVTLYDPNLIGSYNLGDIVSYINSIWELTTVPDTSEPHSDPSWTLIPGNNSTYYRYTNLEADYDFTISKFTRMSDRKGNEVFMTSDNSYGDYCWQLFKWDSDSVVNNKFTNTVTDMVNQPVSWVNNKADSAYLSIGEEAPNAKVKVYDSNFGNQSNCSILATHEVKLNIGASEVSVDNLRIPWGGAIITVNLASGNIVDYDNQLVDVSQKAFSIDPLKSTFLSALSLPQSIPTTLDRNSHHYYSGTIGITTTSNTEIDTISGSLHRNLKIVMVDNTGGYLRFKHGIGNIYNNGGVDVTLVNMGDFIEYDMTPTGFREVARGIY